MTVGQFLFWYFIGCVTILPLGIYLLLRDERKYQTSDYETYLTGEHEARNSVQEEPSITLFKNTSTDGGVSNSAKDDTWRP